VPAAVDRRPGIDAVNDRRTPMNSQRRSRNLTAARLAILCMAVVAFAGIVLPRRARATEPKPPAIPLFSLPRKAHRVSVATPAGSRAKVLDAHLKLEPNGVRALASGLGAKDVSIALPGQENFVVRVAQAPMLAQDLHITATRSTDGNAVENLPFHPLIFKGYIRDQEQSSVGFVVMNDRVFGLANDADHLWFIQPAQTDAPESEDYLLHDLAIESGEVGRFCGTDEVPHNKLVEQSLPPYSVETAPDFGTRLRFRLALDLDYPLIQNIFHGDAAAASSYALLMAALASTIYERDVNVTFAVTYMNLWTVPSPYGSSSDPVCSFLVNFGSYWNANRTSVSRDLAFLVTGGPTSSGGGCAYLSGLCDPSYGYAASFCNGGFPTMPNNQSNYDLFDFTHELGHSLGSPHTHSCFWQANGLLPAGALIDTCVVPSAYGDGSCYSGATHIPPDKGTIMSYCGAVGPGIQYYDRVTRLDFHPLCKNQMRSTVLSKGCLTADPIQPPSDLRVSASQNAVVWLFTPPNNAGVLRYDIYRSFTSLDQNPALLTSTTEAIGVDITPIGMTQGVYYRVKVVTTSGQSGFSNESGTSYCVPSYLTTFPLALPVVGIQQLIPFRVRVADLNDDGLPDAVVAGGSHIPLLTDPPGRLRLLYNTGNQNVADQTFVSGPLLTTVADPKQVIVDDLNDDGIADIAVLGGFNDDLYVHLGQGSNGVSSGTYAAPVEYFPGANVTDMVSADVNQDGIRDLLVSDYTGFSVMLGNGSNGVGDGTFAAPVQYSVPGADYMGGITVFDANKDGILDVACTDLTLNRIWVFAGLGSSGVGNGTFTQSPVYAACGAAPTAIAHGDFNRDGIEDLVVAHSGASSVGVLLGNGSGGVGNGTFQDAVAYPTAYPPATVSVGDWFTDVNRDVLIAEPGPPPGGQAGVFTNQQIGFLLGNVEGGTANGTLTSEVRQVAADGPVDATSDDVNGDGIPDVLAIGSRSPGLGLLYGTCHRAGNYTITVLAPNGGESVPVGTNYTVRWKHGKAIGAVNVDLSRDGGIIWKHLAAALPDTYFVWRAVPPLSSSAKIRVADAVASTLMDLSDANFSIVAAGPQALAAESGPPVTRIQSAHLSRHGAGRILLHLQLSHPAANGAWVELYDVGGRRVARQQLAPAQAAFDTPVDALARPGIYFLRFREPAATDNRKLILTP
jgi:hypothetical protein